MSALFGHYIPPEGIENLKKHKYMPGGYTPIDKVMDHWWKWMESFVPLCIHPNTLTVGGFLIGFIFNTILLTFYFPYLSEMAPSWIYFAVAALFFVYQTLDAMDGKHARRLKLSSPLGQIMDHGCDIMTTTPMSLVAASIMQSGVSLTSYVAIALSTQLLQFLYLWWELHFHVFYCSTGVIGVTEAQFTIIFISLLAGIRGPEVLQLDLSSFFPQAIQQQILRLFQVLGMKFCLSSIFQVSLISFNGMLCIYNIFLALKNTKAFKAALTQLTLFIVYLSLQGVIFLHCLIEMKITPIIVYSALCSSYGIYLLRLCLSATCRFPFQAIQWPLVPIAIIAGSVCSGLLNSVHVTWILVAWSIINWIYLIDFITTNVNDICKALNITCFTVPKAVESKGPVTRMSTRLRSKQA